MRFEILLRFNKTLRLLLFNLKLGLEGLKNKNLKLISYRKTVKIKSHILHFVAYKDMNIVIGYGNMMSSLPCALLQYAAVRVCATRMCSLAHK